MSKKEKTVVSNDVVETKKKKKISPKKLWTIITCSVVAVALIATTYWAVINYVLIDYQNMAYLTFHYSVSDTDVNHIPEVTITGVNSNKKYPKNFRVPNKLLGYKVTGIGDYAFAGLDRIVSITLPDTITSIGTGAFSSCENLKSVKLESKNLTNVGEDIFLDSDKWEGNSIEGIVMFGSLLYKYNKEMEEGTSVKPIEKKIDGEDESKTIYISDDVTLIASGAFSYQPNLVSFELPDRFTSVSNSLVQGCANLSSFTAKNATSIGKRAFANCTSLTEFDFSKVTSIDEEAFKGTSITSVSLNDEMTLINNGVFKDCSELEAVKFSNNMARIGSESFMNCTNLTSLENGSIDGLSFTNDLNNIVFIGSSAFANSGLTSFSVPNKVTTINESTFRDCTNLVSVNLPEVVALTGDDRIDPYGKYAYSGLQTIEANAFKNTTSLKEFNIPYYKGEYIQRSSNGTETTFQNVVVNTLYSIGDSAFEGSGIENLALPASLNSVPKNAFKDCADLKNLTFQDPNNTVTVGIYNGSVVVNEARTSSIGTSAFENTPLLSSLDLPNSVIAIQSSAFKNSGINRVTLPNNEAFNTIAEYTFSHCENLSDIVINSNINTIKRNAFEYTGLTSITIPETLKKVETSIFFGCEELTTINLDFSEQKYDEFLSLGSKGWNSNWNLLNTSGDKIDNIVFLKKA